jgi:hypothetical protein
MEKIDARGKSSAIFPRQCFAGIGNRRLAGRFSFPAGNEY